MRRCISKSEILVFCRLRIIVNRLNQNIKITLFLIAAYSDYWDPVPVSDIILEKNKRHIIVNIVAANVRQHATAK